MARLITYLYRHCGRALFIATAGALVTALTATGMIVIISKAVRIEGRLGSLPWIFFGLCAAWLIAKSCSEISLVAATQSLVYRLRVSLARCLLATPIPTIEGLQKSQLFAMLTQDVETLAAALPALSRSLGCGILTLACLAYIATMSWSLAAIVATILIGGCSSYLFLERGFRGGMDRLRHQLDIVYKGVRDLIEGTKQLQLNAGRGSSYLDRVIAADAQDYKQVLVATRTGYTWVLNMSVLLFYLMVGSLLFFTPLWWPGGASIAVSVTLILLYLLGPIIELMSAVPGLRQAAVALKRIEQMDNVLMPPRESDAGPDPFATPSSLVVELREVRYEYSRGAKEAPFVLGPISLTVRPCEILFIVGGNGSGKTTLALLLLGLYRPHSGEIIMNGIPVTDENVEHYRTRFSAVLSDFHLFENLLEADHDEGNNRIDEYLEALDMTGSVKVENGRFSTIDLSSGQRKRLALLAAYVEDRPFYLFDEWAADQDPMFKRVFYRRLLPELRARGKTVVVISHDDSYFSCADRIIKVTDGHLDAGYGQAAAMAMAEMDLRA